MRITFSCPPHLRALLPPPVAARRTLPDWIQTMALDHEIPDFGKERTVKNCPPFVDAMSHALIIPLATDIHVQGGRFTWNWPADESPMSFHFATQLPGVPFVQDGQSAIKFVNYWTIGTEEGWSVLFTHPFNRPDLPFQTLGGLVDTDGFNLLPVNFPALWIDPDFEGVLPKGTPIVQCIPVRRERLDVVIGEFDDQAVAARAELKEEVKQDPNYYKNRLRRPRPPINLSEDP